MSILNVSVRPDVALVGVDSEMVAPADGQCVHGSKLLALPHLNAVFGFRGATLMFFNLFQLALFFTGRDFDELLDNFTALLVTDAVSKAFDATAQSLGLPIADPAFYETELAIAGWSPGRSRVVGRLFTQKTRDGFTAQEIDGMFVAPDDGSLGTPPDLGTPAAMEAWVRKQVQLIKASAPGAAGGGQLILAELTRHTVSITQHCDLDTPRARPTFPLKRRIGAVRLGAQPLNNG